MATLHGENVPDHIYNDAQAGPGKTKIDSGGNGEIEFLVPDVFWAEVIKVLRKGVRQRRWTRPRAEEFSAGMSAREFRTISSLALIQEASKIAFAHDRSVYDCLYVALAIRARTEFVTADERLVNAVGAHLPVNWLGGF